MLGRIKLGRINLSLVLLAVGGVLTIVGFIAYSLIKIKVIKTLKDCILNRKITPLI